MATRQASRAPGGDTPDPCPFPEIARVLGGSWNLQILHELQERPLAFHELKERVEGIPPNVLSQRLTELQHRDLVHRRVEESHPVRVRYRLSEPGRELDTAFEALQAWGERWISG